MTGSCVQHYITPGARLTVSLCDQDPLETVRQTCEGTEHCVHTRHKLEACEARVSSRPNTAEDCTEELFDFLHARDHCVSALRVNLCKIFNCTCIELYKTCPALHRSEGSDV